MQLGMIGLGRMGANMVRRVMAAGHECVVYDVNAQAVDTVAREGAIGAATPEDLVARLRPPRAVWIMVPAAVVEPTLERLSHLLAADDSLIDGGNSYYKDDLVRGKALAEMGIHYLDVGTSGGLWGLERGYCLMIGGDRQAVDRLASIFDALAPGLGEVARTRGRSGEPSPAERGWLHCGPHGAGHFAKMVHNGIEYGLMAAYAEGLNLLRHANVGSQAQLADAETAPLRDPEAFRYDFDVAEIAELWRRGSVVASWLLDLTATALQRDPSLTDFSGRVSDSGEGRWTAMAGIEAGVPLHILTAALFNRFASRGEGDYADKLLSAMRYEFGGHHEKAHSDE
jgi:6-phosphogluconate dehydrogenase